MARANAGEPADDALVFRVGLHLGDVIVDGEDLYGDGVNIAARLEGEAPAGGIVVSGDVHNAVAGRLKATFADLGDLSLKNIDRPIRAMRVTWAAADWPVVVDAPAASPASATPPEPRLALPDKPSIAVLPFQNMSGDPEQEYFVDGLVEDIITALSRFKSLFVIARNSSFTYKGKAVDIKQAGRELGVRYVLEGSVRKSGNRIRITGQLIDAVGGSHLWADRFDGAVENVFDLQDRVTTSVVGVIAPRVEMAEMERVRGKAAGNLNAYDLVLRAQALMRVRSRAALEEALGLVRRAVELDPTYARALACLTVCCWYYIAQGFGHRDHPMVSDISQIAQKALALDPLDSDVVAIAGGMLAFPGGDIESGAALVEKAITLNPNNAEAFRSGANMYGFMGEVDKAVEYQERADRFNPVDAGWSGNVACVIAYFGAGMHEKVIDWTARILGELPNAAAVLRYRAASLALVGRVDEARQVVQRILNLTPSYTIGEVRRHHEFDMNNPFKRPGVTESLYRGLRLAGLPE
ncbi:MAG: adenylate/guanylate cyclase domain-containing protein, partial [Parvibaculum sp.]|nr:adenylate/guanylate cyclase domain-containing protein [Parvibaculum sp.]